MHYFSIFLLLGLVRPTHLSLVVDRDLTIWQQLVWFLVYALTVLYLTNRNLVGEQI